jgi:hypothetical protein
MPFEISSLRGLFPIKFQSPFRCMFFKYLLESILMCQGECFLAVSYEFIAEFSTEVGVTPKIGVVVYPIQVIVPGILLDAAVGCQ